MSSEAPSEPRPTVVSIRGVGKEYHLGATSSQSLRELLSRRIGSLLGRGKPDNTFWALSDVNLDVRQGDVVGLIGRNGSGKSTLLKILSRITEPTVGEIDLVGRVGSLLEVGTGFHPELTGRENVYLNGSILGMTRREIDERFDEIVDFSGVEKFLDTPVKRFSSGMFVRLAFAVAAHLEPEILIVDEVLAVGDAEFQRKCLGKMQDAAGQGRTVIFVSHNLGTIQQLCTRGVLLVNGRVEANGTVEEAVGHYLSLLHNTTTDGQSPVRGGDGSVRLERLRLLNGGGAESTVFIGGDDVTLALDYDNPAGRRNVSLRLNIYNDRGAIVTSGHTELTNPDLGKLSRRGTLLCKISRLPLTIGTYRVAVAISADNVETDVVPAAAVFDVVSSVYYPTGRAMTAGTAAFLLDHEWEHLPTPASASGTPPTPTTPTAVNA